MSILALNSLQGDSLEQALLRCCHSTNWVKLMVKAHPFASKETLHETAVSSWKEMGREDILEAFLGHPMIGADIDALRKKFQTTSSWSEGEQSGIAEASTQTILALQKANKEYLIRFGYIFIVCATGKTAMEMLTLVQERLHNDPEQELAIAAGEQQKVTAIRLEKL